MTIPEHVDRMAGFYLPWAAAVAVTPATPVPRHLGEVLMIDVGGLPVPIVTLVLALAGVLLARPLSPRREPPLGWIRSIAVTLLMMGIAAIWVIESRPNVLFAFVIAIGLGFSGYALIELAGTEVTAFLRNIITRAVGIVPPSPPASPPPSAPEPYEVQS